MPRPCSSCTSARAARPSAPAAPSSSSTISARMLIRLVLRWIIGVLLLWQRVPHEERACPLVELAQPLRVQGGEFGGGIRPAQGAIDLHAEVVVAVLERQSRVLVCQHAVLHPHARRGF